VASSLKVKKKEHAVPHRPATFFEMVVRIRVGARNLE